MIRHRSGFVLGYHGCDEAVAETILGGDPMRISTRDYDWLGPGAYFWEGDADRAREWAEQRVAEGAYAAPGSCQSNANCSPLTRRALEGLCSAGKQLPFGQGGRTAFAVGLTINEVAFLSKMVVNRSVNRDEFLQRLHSPEPQHRAFSSSEWEV